MTDRHTVDTITSDALDALYKQAALAEQWRALAVRRRERVEEAEQRADTYQAAWHSARDRARKHARHAEQADTVTARTKQLLERRTKTLRERAEQAEELLRIAHETSNKSEAERARAVQRAEAAERDARIYRERLARLTDGYAEQLRRLDRVRALAEHWQASVRPGEPHPAAVAVRIALGEPGPAATQATKQPEIITDRATIRTALDEPGCTCTYGNRCPNCRD